MTRSLIVAVGADHGGAALKNRLSAVLIEGGHQVLDFGTDGPASVDYPDFAQAVCGAVRERSADLGILVCGTGLGMSIAANRFPEIRCALVHDVTTARLTRAHNDANVLALGARITVRRWRWIFLALSSPTPMRAGGTTAASPSLNPQTETQE